MEDDDDGDDDLSLCAPLPLANTCFLSAVNQSSGKPVFVVPVIGEYPT